MNCIVKLSRIIGISLLLLLLILANTPVAVLAAPGDETTTGTVSLVPTIECIGVVSSFTGDNNQNNSATLEYRESGTTSWKTAPEMYADRDNQQYRGSIFWLTTDTEYEVRVSYNDPDGVSGSSAIATTRTRNDNPPSNGNTYYVATTGSDSNAGTQASPFRTIQKAADTVSAGDTVLVRAGTYSETVTISKSGLPASYITICPAGDGEVTLDGNGAVIFTVTGKYIRIRGFTMRNATYGVYASAADGLIVEDSNIVDPTTGGIHIRNKTKDTLIQRNTFTINAGSAGTRGTIHGVYYWETGGGHVFRKNTLTGGAPFRDAVSSGPEDDSSMMHDNDFYDNIVVGARDDGIQPEGGNRNVRIWGNRIEGSFIGIAVCPTKVGPCYIFRNIVIGGSGYKLGDRSYGRIYSFHNTFYGSQGYSLTNSGFGNMVSRNNIIRATRYVFEMGGENHDFDYDCMFTTDPTRFIKWSGGTLMGSLASFQSQTGQEPHGLESEPGFVNPSGGDLSLVSSSPCMDAGEILPCFNDENSPWPYRGSAPDIGAYEYDSGAPTNSPPVLNTIGNKSVTAGQLLQFTISASDPNGDSLTYSASNLPSGASFNAATRTFSWTPSSSQVGNHSNIYFRVSDGTLIDTETITITVISESSNSAPVLNTIGSKSVTAEQLLQFTISATDPNGDPLTYSASNLPSGASFNAASRTFSWTPSLSQVGPHSNIYFQVSDDALIDTETITITVYAATLPGGDMPPPTNSAPVLNSIGDKSVTAGQLLQFTISAIDPNGDLLTCSAYNLPSGASFDAATGTFSWTPGYEQAGSYVTVRFGVSDGILTDFEDVMIMVGEDSSPPEIGNLVVSETTTNSVTIRWVTDEPATSQVVYRARMSKFSLLDETLVTEHTVRLTDLTPGTVYHYRAISRDQAGNIAVSASYKLTTSQPPTMSDFSVSDLIITPATEVLVGTDVSTSVLVKNTGDIDGSYVVTFKVDGKSIASKTINLAAGSSQRVTHTERADDAGVYRWDVNGLTARVIAKKVVGWATLGMIVGGTLVVIIAVVLIALYPRRRKFRDYVENK